MEPQRRGIHTVVFVDNVLWYKFLINKMSVLNIDDDKVTITKNLQHHGIITNETDAKPTSKTYNHYQVTQTSAQMSQEVLKMDGYVLSSFINLLQSSILYRKLVIANLSRLNLTSKSKSKYIIPLCIHLQAPKYEMFDLNWNHRVEWMLMERRELDSAMSWFSTFGGAFSALGEEFQHCAEMAGKISLQQMRLALRLGDPLTVARCRLYWALSCIQRGQLRTARAIIITQLSLARSHADDRLERMCFGIYARLKYEHRCRWLSRLPELQQTDKCSRQKLDLRANWALAQLSVVT